MLNENFEITNTKLFSSINICENKTNNSNSISKLFKSVSSPTNQNTEDKYPSSFSSVSLNKKFNEIKSSIYDSWYVLTMKLLSKQSSNWENLMMVVHLAASDYNPSISLRRPSISGEEFRQSRLTTARKKSLTLQEMMSPHWNNRRRFSEIFQIDLNTNIISINNNFYDNNQINNIENDNQHQNNDNNDNGYKDDQEEDEWMEERRAVGDDRIIFNPITLQAFDSITNQEYNPLDPLLHDSIHYDVLGTIHPAINETLSEIDSDINYEKNESIDSLMKPMNTLSLVLAEVISTEVTFVDDIIKLNSLLEELKYSTLESVKLFVDSKYYTGIYTATQTIKITNSQFLKSMQLKKLNNDGSSNNTNNENLQDPEEKFSILFSQTTQQCETIFDAFTRYTPFFSLFSQFIVNHDGLSLLYQNLINQDENFKSFLNHCEKNVNQQIMSLIIKPVQRLPRYVLLTKEIQHRLRKLRVIHEEVRVNEDQKNQILGLDQANKIKVKQGMCSTRYEKICSLETWSQNILNIMADCAQECNNSVRKHQDNLRMHQLQEMFKDSGSELNIVSKDRLLIKEGELIRHHRGGSTEIHLIQLFSDVLISSSRTIRGLKPQRTFNLSKDSNILCLSIPPKHQSQSEMNTWFVLVSDEKSIFFEAKSHNEVLEWVDLINKQLIQNQAFRDIYNVKSQINLVNTILAEIKRRTSFKKNIDQNKDSNTISKNFDESFLQQIHYVQTGWWYLLNILEELTSKEESHIPMRYKRLIEKQCKDIASQLILTIIIKKNESNNLIQSLLFNNSLHYLITIGTVFEYQAPCSVTNIELYDRPLLMKLFLLSDVLIGTYIESANESVVYNFHILIQDLEFSDKMPDGSHSNAIILLDKSKPTKRRLSLLSFGNSDCIKRIIHTSTLEEKFEWLSLLYLTKKRFEDERLGYVPIIGTTKDDNSPHTHLNKLKSGSFESLSNNFDGIRWKYEC